MLTAAALAALLAVSPAVPGSAVPAPAATDAPLREIGHVHATTAFCKAALETASSGVAVAMQNDVRIRTSETTLRKTDYDANELAKSNGLIALNRQYAELRAEAVRGNGILKSLKAQAALAPTETQQRDLLAFAEALDGALGRQKKLADVIGRIVVILENHPAINWNAQAEMEINALYIQNFSGTYHDPQGPFHDLPDPLDKMANDSADDLALRAQPIQDDETRAASLIEPAFAGC